MTVGNPLQHDQVWLATNGHIQARSLTAVMNVGNRLLSDII